MIDRDKILVPANWDSWGKIRIIREGFDIEGVGNAWSIEIQDPPQPLYDSSAENGNAEDQANEDDGSSAVAIYEQTIKDPKRETSIARSNQASANKIEIEAEDMQTFLAKQSEMLEQLKQEDEKDRAARKIPKLEMSALEDNGRVNEHIGPVQFNMGGIQVDADDMLRKLKVSVHSLSLFSKCHVTNIHKGERSQSSTKERSADDISRRREGTQPSAGELLRRSCQETRRQSPQQSCGLNAAPPAHSLFAFHLTLLT